MKRILSMILALCMLLCLVPFAAMAAETSGSCGNELRWSFNEATGEMTISGTGPMTNYGYNNLAPWTDILSSIKKVTIEDGVENIGMWAFVNAVNLTEVVMADSVVHIGTLAFDGCTNLKTVKFSPNIYAISANAFRNCTSLTAITLTEKMTTFGTGAFEGCAGLTSVFIPKSVNFKYQIGSIFAGCTGLTSVTFEDGLTVIDKQMFKGCTSLTSVTIPSSVLTIDSGAFANCTSLASVTIGAGVQVIEDAFYGCTALTSLSYPDSVSKMGAISGNSSLTSFVVPVNVTQIPILAFNACPKLNTVVIQGVVTEIGQSAFTGCKALENILYTGSAEEWATISIGSSNGVLDNATIHHGCTEESENVWYCPECGETFDLAKLNEQAPATPNTPSTDTPSTDTPSTDTPSTDTPNEGGSVSGDAVIENPFTDISDTKYYYDAVLWAYSNNVTTGSTATTFDPSGDCTRKQVVTFLWRAAGSPEPTTTENPFTDIPNGKYYTKAVLWAYENGITTGKTATYFDADSTCTRKQIAMFLYRYNKVLGGDSTTGSVENPFTDVGGFYEDAILWAYDNGITTGKTETTFQPDATCIRCQIVTFLHRYFVGE